MDGSSVMSGEEKTGAVWRLRQLILGWLRAYAQVGFARSPLSGLFFFVATMVVPQHGSVGLLGLVIANGWARLLGRPAAHIDEGFYGLNGLLLGLGLGLYYRLTPQLIVLLILATLLVVVVAAASRNLAERYLGVPVLGLPFMIATWAALLATKRFGGLEITLAPIFAGSLGAGLLPEVVEVFFKSLGAVFFQINVVSGGLVLIGLLWSSRWMVLLAVVGFAAGALVYQALGGVSSDLDSHFMGLNFLLVAVAVGGIYVVLSPGSIVLAASAGALTAVTGAALVSLLGVVGLPALAMPFILTTQILIFALMIRSGGVGPKLVVGVPGTPEENLRRVVHRARRYPDAATPLVHLPVMGRWIVTQGPSGEHTHQGLWSHAWDFEVVDEDGERHRGSGAQVEDWYAWQAPVVAAADGKVVRVLQQLEDNPVGEVNVSKNWGNLVIVWHHTDVFSMSCHLAQGSVTVREGESVVRGQVIGRVGNSGRSPVPHLHFQLQASGEIGAPTRYGELLHYFTGAGEELGSDGESVASSQGLAYITHGVPDVGERVEGLSADEDLRRAFSLPPGRTLRWKVLEDAAGEVGREESWSSVIDAIGQRALVTERGRAPFFSDGCYSTVLDYEGDGGTLLSLYALAAARLPFAERPGLSWRDAPASTALLSPVARLGVELLLPFYELGVAHTHSRLRCVGDRVIVFCEIAFAGGGVGHSKLPERFEVAWSQRAGLFSLSAWRGDERVLHAEVIS